MPALIARFPLNDGGMFMDMTRELAANQYLLPATTAYNGLDLPYAYPPFGFYLTALLADFGRIPLLSLFLWLPALFAILAIPVFYLLARALLADDLHAALATLFFALTPGSYFWHLMGGGITRATGFLFLLLTAVYTLRLFQGQKPAHVFAVIAFASLAVLSHPEVGLQTAGLCAVFWLFHGRTKRGTLQALFVVAGVLIFTAPWWGTVLAQHGLSPYLSALQTGQHADVDWLELLVDLFRPGELIPILFLLRLLGFVYAMWKRQYILLAMIIIPAVFDPRSASSIGFLAMNMLAALAVAQFLPALIGRLRNVEPNEAFDQRTRVFGIITLTTLLLVQCGLRNYTLINTTLSIEEREAMTWLSENVPPGREFYLVTGRMYSMSDPAQEWFPTLTGQRSQTTLQGLEWSLGPRFTERLDDLTVLQACETISCVEAWSTRTGLSYDHLWVVKSIESLAGELAASQNYRLVFETESLAVYARIK